jgi:hypothetical protein
MSESTGAPAPQIPPTAPEPQTAPADTQLPTAPPNAPSSPHDVEVARLNSGLKTMRKQYETAQAELDKLKTASQTEQEQAVAKARASALLNAAQARLALKGVKSIGLAAGALNLADITFDPNTGVVDQAALDARIDELLTQYPELIPDGRVPPAQMDGSQQKRVNGQDLVNASVADKNALLRYALGR